MKWWQKDIYIGKKKRIAKPFKLLPLPLYVKKPLFKHWTFTFCIVFKDRETGCSLTIDIGLNIAQIA